MTVDKVVLQCDDNDEDLDDCMDDLDDPIRTEVMNLATWREMNWMMRPKRMILTPQHSTDEAMIKYQGRSFLKQYIPLKPTKRGIKVWVATDSSNGYLS